MQSVIYVGARRAVAINAISVVCGHDTSCPYEI